jgi:SGNH hydrolase-like domain, acetyltransferase AlgX
MSSRKPDLHLGTDEARPPQHSLPRYAEPTPETHRRISREEEAELALENTSFTRASRPLLIALFLATIAFVPFVQFTAEMTRGRTPSLPAIFKPLPTWTKITNVRNPADVWRLLPRAQEIKASERIVERESVLAERLLPGMQLALSSLQAGNEQVYIGRNGWLFYRADVDYITAPPFLDKARMSQRLRADAVEPDPIKAVVDFRNQLASRGIDLIVIPVPGKPSIDPEYLWPDKPPRPSVTNPSMAEFEVRLSKAGVNTFDPTLDLIAHKRDNQDAPSYLQTDTHWRPETMELVAKKLSAFIRPQDGARNEKLSVSPRDITATGDIATMLKLPPWQRLYSPQTVTIHQVTSGNELWSPRADADILLLGDSFANIFSLEAMGWGESAGFAEHLSVALGGRPLDCIIRNNDGAFATREILQRELTRGRDRLAGKKLVIWEFAARELAFGNWKLLRMSLGQPRPSHFFTLSSGETVTVTGTVQAVSSPPRPGTVPYRDHIIALHLVDIAGDSASTTSELHALVYLWSMRDNRWMPAARLRAGDRVTLRLRSWAEVSAECEKFNRTDLDDPSLQTEEPVWGELVR